MAAHEGNKNAEKWTPETVMPILELMEQEKKHFLFLGEMLAEHGLYTEIWSYWKDKFDGTEIVFQAIKRLEQHFENQLVGNALRNKVNATMAIFTLKNKYGWQDRTSTELTGKDGEPLVSQVTINIRRPDENGDNP